MKRSILALAVLVVMSIPLAAQQFSLPHDPKNPNHWYPEGCCSLMDCEVTPIEAVTPTEENGQEGWRVQYRSKRFGAINEFVSKSNKKVQVNEHDGQFHGCWYTDTDDPRRFHGPGNRMICFWYPLWS